MRAQEELPSQPGAQTKSAEVLTQRAQGHFFFFFKQKDHFAVF